MERIHEFISYDSPSANKIYGPIKFHRVNNPVRIITSGCNTAVGNLPIFAEKALFQDVERIPSTIKDKNHMLDIVYNLNDPDLLEISVLVGLDVMKMFPCIDNESGKKTVKKVLNETQSKHPPTECILEVLRICLECNSSVLNGIEGVIFFLSGFCMMKYINEKIFKTIAVGSQF